MKVTIFLVAALALLPSMAQCEIGSISGLSGSAATIKRGSSTTTAKNKSSVESMDTVNTGTNTVADIEFVDSTKVKITANSRLLIDDFVYDANKSDAGKLGMKVALGTVRYTSGQIAKNNPQSVSIRTPTATISVRGTDFAMTVDEIGRSLIVLLPSCVDETALNRFDIMPGNCVTGQIDVETAAGLISITQPYMATYVTDAGSSPMPPQPIEQVASNINNDQILKLPGVVSNFQADDLRRKKKKRYPGVTDPDAEEMLALDEDNTNIRDSKTEIIQSKKEDDSANTRLINPCAPFDTCGNEKGLNYYKKGDEKGNVIYIASGERLDNTTYNFSINNNDMTTKVVGTGTNVVTVRQWNR